MKWTDTLLGDTRARILGLLRRSRSTIADLAAAVGISGNAVRGHLAALQTDGLAEEVGTAPSTGGKPARVYDITPEGEELFAKAYALVLSELIRTLEERDGRQRTLEALREVGRKAAASVERRTGGTEAGVEAAADALRAIGGDVTVRRLEGDEGWEIRGFGCPLSAVVVREPDACALAQALVQDLTGAEVLECCDRSGGRARCRFRVSPPGSP